MNKDDLKNIVICDNCNGSGIGITGYYKTCIVCDGKGYEEVQQAILKKLGVING